MKKIYKRLFIMLFSAMMVFGSALPIYAGESGVLTGDVQIITAFEDDDKIVREHIGPTGELIGIEIIFKNAPDVLQRDAGARYIPDQPRFGRWVGTFCAGNGAPLASRFRATLYTEFTPTVANSGWFTRVWFEPINPLATDGIRLGSTGSSGSSQTWFTVTMGGSQVGRVDFSINSAGIVSAWPSGRLTQR